MKGRILIVDDDRDLCVVLEARLQRAGYEVAWCTEGREALHRAAEETFDVVLTDLNMRGIDGIELAERLAASRPDVPVVVITAFGSLDTAVAAIRAGAYDFITKPFEVEFLDLALSRAVQHRALREELVRLRSRQIEVDAGWPLIGSSRTMTRLRELVNRVAQSDAPVLIRGETGTGKELVARAVHERSGRARGPFVAVNCAAVPGPLLESELFGHVKGAFTDARSDRVGLVTSADAGTLFLDEVGDLPLEFQPKLLRMLQERSVRPVGSDRESPFDARVVAATNRDLEDDIESGRFREDLFFRLDVLSVEVPALRARGSDVLLLAQHFLERSAASAGKRVSGISTPAAKRLVRYAWPGNVRELANCIERAVALTSYDRIVVDDLPDRIRKYRRRDVIVASEDPSELVSLDEVERRYAHRVLEAVGGNKTAAARILGVDRKTLYRKLGPPEDRKAGSPSDGDGDEPGLSGDWNVR